MIGEARPRTKIFRARRRRRRRVLVVSAVAAALIGAGMFGYRALRNSDLPVFGPGSNGIRTLHYTFESRLLHRSLDEFAAVPPSLSRGGRRPLLLEFHGRGGSPESTVSGEMLAALKSEGATAPVVVGVNGGDHGYYHDRRGEPWATYVLTEIIPDAVRRFHADPKRVGVDGFSMGGFGALNLGRVAPQRFCAVAGHSAAVWRTGGETSLGSFDDAEDFARNDVFGSAQHGTDPYHGDPLWLDVGNGDPFHNADVALAAALRRDGTRITFHTWPGGHNSSYRDANALTILRFFGSAFASCHR